MIRRSAAALVAVASLLGWAAPARAHGATEQYRVLVFWVDRISFEELLATPEVRALARAGAAGLLTSPETVRPLVHDLLRDPAYPGLDEDVVAANWSTGSPSGPVVLGARMRQTIESTPGELLVIVAGVEPSAAMEAADDRVTGVVMASGHAEELFPASGPLRALTSDSTRRDGVVAAVDVPATILAFMDWPLDGVTGSRIRVTAEPGPFELHERHLANMRLWLPVQAAAVAFVIVAGLACVGLLLLRSRVPAGVGRAATWVPLAVLPLGAALLAGGRLPSLAPGWVWPVVVGVPVVLVVLASCAGDAGSIVPAAAIGAAVLLYMSAESLGGFDAALTPFLGGTQLDGARFYGLPNAFIGLLLGAGLYVAMRLRAVPGAALLAATALLAGLPLLGANHGGALTLFAGAGLWLGLRARGRLGPRELALAAAVVGVGMVLVIAAHALSPTPTHGTRFLQDVDGVGGLLSKLGDRLLIGLRLIARNPLASLPVLGVPVCLYLVVRPRGVLREALEASAAWRDAIVVALLASVVAYLGNDTGASAAGLGFGSALGGMLHVSMARASWKMGP